MVETKLLEDAMKGKKYEVGFTQGLIVPSDGKSEGLALLWKQDLNVSVKGYSRWYIDAIVDTKSDVGTWRFTGFYDQPGTSKRYESWAQLKELSQKCNMPWICVGDFNEVLKSYEKSGGIERPAWQIRSFKETLDAYDLCDLGYIGQWYTWSVTGQDHGHIQERIDRATANMEWKLRFPMARVYHISSSVSDHCLISVRQNGNSIRQKRKKKYSSLNPCGLEIQGVKK